MCNFRYFELLYEFHITVILIFLNFPLFSVSINQASALLTLSYDFCSPQKNSKLPIPLHIIKDMQ